MQEKPLEGPYGDANLLAEAQAIPDSVRCQFCERPMTADEFRALKHPFVERAQMRSAGAASDAQAKVARAAAIAQKRAQGPVAVLSRLAVDASVVFYQYRQCSQLSASVQTVSIRTGARFTCAREISLVTGEVIGVRATRTK